MVLVVQLGFFVWINPGSFAAFYKQIIVTLGNLVYMPQGIATIIFFICVCIAATIIELCSTMMSLQSYHNVNN